MNPRSSESGHTRGGTLTSRLRALGIIAFGLALLPGAVAISPSPAPSAPVVATRLDPYPPLDTDEPTFEERQNARARQILDSEPWHYKCREYGPRAELMPEDIIPTGNVSAEMEYDPRTGGYETTSVDSKHIVISHETSSQSYPALPDPIVRDVYRWTYAPGVKHYGAFVLYNGPHGTQWARVYATHENGVYKYDDLVRGRHESRSILVIVATNTASCDAGKPVPSTLWRDATAHGLNDGADK